MKGLAPRLALFPLGICGWGGFNTNMQAAIVASQVNAAMCLPKSGLAHSWVSDSSQLVVTQVPVASTSRAGRRSARAAGLAARPAQGARAARKAVCSASGSQQVITGSEGAAARCRRDGAAAAAAACQKRLTSTPPR